MDVYCPHILQVCRNNSVPGYHVPDYNRHEAWWKADICVRSQLRSGLHPSDIYNMVERELNRRIVPPQRDLFLRYTRRILDNLRENGFLDGICTMLEFGRSKGAEVWHCEFKVKMYERFSRVGNQDWSTMDDDMRDELEHEVHPDAMTKHSLTELYYSEQAKVEEKHTSNMAFLRLHQELTLATTSHTYSEQSSSSSSRSSGHSSPIQEHRLRGNQYLGSSRGLDQHRGIEVDHVGTTSSRSQHLQRNNPQRRSQDGAPSSFPMFSTGSLVQSEMTSDDEDSEWERDWYSDGGSDSDSNERSGWEQHDRWENPPPPYSVDDPYPP